MKKWFKKSPAVAKNISPNQKRRWAKLFAVPDAFMLGSFLDDSTAQTRSSPRLSTEGGGNSLLQHRDAGTGSLCLALVALDGDLAVFTLPAHASLPHQHPSAAFGAPEIFPKPFSIISSDFSLVT